MARVPPRKTPATPLGALLDKHLEDLRVKNYSEYTIRGRQRLAGFFLEWAEERGITEPTEVTRTVLEAYQRHIFHHRKKNGEPLHSTAQQDRIIPLRVWFKWMARHHYILHNPASELELPRLGFRLPRTVLTAQEAERVLAQPDIHDPLGLRDRAILEVLYSTGMRRLEVVKLKVWDLDLGRVAVTIREAKGRKDRIIPLGERAALWVRNYLDEERPQLVNQPDDYVAFLSSAGERLTLDHLTYVARRWVDAADLGKRGACHLFRHTMAMLMLEGGADIRFIQAMLGHANLTTTQIYTHVAVRQLQEIHRATHPARLPQPKEPAPADEAARAELLSALAAEEEDEEGEEPL
jgi:integrase/recombinase XerD